MYRPILHFKHLIVVAYVQQSPCLSLKYLLENLDCFSFVLAEYFSQKVSTLLRFNLEFRLLGLLSSFFSFQKAKDKANFGKPVCWRSREVTMDFLQSLSLVKSNRLGTTIWVAKVVLLTMGTISTVILFKGVIVPYTFSFIFSTFPPLLISVRSWLSVPFLYIIVNFIIISIAVSSNFHNKKQVSPPQPSTNPNSTDSTIISEDVVLESTIHYAVRENSDNPREEAKELQQPEETTRDSALSYEKPGTNPLLVTEDCDHPIEKKIEELRQRKELGHCALSCAKSDMNPPLGKSSGDYVPQDSDEKCDDMEATWRAIMEREGKQVTWKLKKSETWGEKTKEKPLHKSQVGEDDDHVAWARRELRKFDTFNDTASLKRDKSMSPEELYRQAEAFIQKINNQMRLQRLESEQRFMEMVNRSV